MVMVMFIVGIGERVALLQLRAASSVSFAMANTEILTDEGAVTIWEITAEDLLRCVWVHVWVSSEAGGGGLHASSS